MFVALGRGYAQSIPELKVKMSDNNEQSLKIKKLNIDVKVIGNLAITTMDMTFTNDFPENKQYEGTLIFPIADGQSINRLAMDFHGIMREGVVVEKEKGRVVFEDIERKKVDPALLEKTTSNNYKLRVYPIVSKQEKHIIIAYEQILKSDEYSMTYNLPLNYNYNIEDFSLTANVYSEYPVNNSKTNQIDEIKFNKESNAYTTAVNFKNYLANEMFGFTMPLPEDSREVITETIDGENYFSINRNIELPQDIYLEADKITILWDCSHSSQYRNFEKEFKLLQEYFNQNKNCEVELITFNYKIKSKENFTIYNSNINELKAKLEKVKYDGGSNFDCINIANTSADAVLLFSDGISSIGNSKPVTSKAPVYAVTSTMMNNAPYLYELSLRSGGNYINLLSNEDDKAAKLLTNKSYRLISVEYNPIEISEIYPKSTANLLEGLAIAGKMNGNYAELTLNYGYGNNISKSEKITINKQNDDVKTGILGRIWAKKKLDELQINKKVNKDEILQIGKAYNIVTDETSLIILENANDYVRYGIEAPKNDEKLYKEYQKQKDYYDKNMDRELPNNKEYNINALIKEFSDRKTWYNTDFKKKAQEQKRILDSITEYHRAGGTLQNNGTAVEYSSNPLAPEEATSSESVQVISNIQETVAKSSRTSLDKLVGTQAGVMNTGDGYTVRGSRVNEASLKTYGDIWANSVVGGGNINLSAYKSDAEYFNDFKSAKAETDDIYFKNKEKYGKSIGYYIDIAEILTEKGKKAEAVEVITNIAELSEENQEFLRIVAYKLQFLGEIDLSVKLLEYIKEIRGEEPQSYRDLALALVDKGEYQRACDLLYEMALKSWNNRFYGTNLTAITEMNAIISRFPGKINTSKYNPELISAMPLDMRIVLRWDLDNTDIDLWVTDPNKEKCFYSHKLTKIGGLLPKDFTGGYGPEEFLLKKASKGNYIIECNYFGSSAVKMTGGATLFLDLYTNYGKQNETKKTIVYRVKENKETVKIGEYEFK